MIWGYLYIITYSSAYLPSQLCIKLCSFWWVNRLTVMYILAFVYTSYLSMISTISGAHTILCRPTISLCLLETHHCIKLGWSSPQSGPIPTPETFLWCNCEYTYFKKIFSPKENIIMAQPHEKVIQELSSRDFHINSFLQNENHN